MSEKIRRELKSLQEDIAKHRIGLDKISQHIKSLRGASGKADEEINRQTSRMEKARRK